MEAFKTALWIINVFSALAVIVLVLMQQGKGADAGAAFGSGSAQGVFGSAGSASFLSRGTAVAATIFFATCLGLGYVSTNKSSQFDFEAQPVQTQQSAPATEQPSTNGAVLPE